MCQQETKWVGENAKELDSSVFNVYSPWIGLKEYPKVKFWKDLKGLIKDIP
ncbi:hypothetical protein MTR_1g021200 [Medicago truncatula]|uniref:Uncharacterized protein n=1 Tax=Medicago truncatula TaxID=3880 RepID=G7I4J4_MEDTR|nr:hypothetical protein MTR_1g021200 [Medicago truncatula]